MQAKRVSCNLVPFHLLSSELSEEEDDEDDEHDEHDEHDEDDEDDEERERGGKGERRGTAGSDDVGTDDKCNCSIAGGQQALFESASTYAVLTYYYFLCAD